VARDDLHLQVDTVSIVNIQLPIFFHGKSLETVVWLWPSSRGDESSMLILLCFTQTNPSADRLER
jgi:hypothetical protein